MEVIWMFSPDQCGSMGAGSIDYRVDIEIGEF